MKRNEYIKWVLIFFIIGLIANPAHEFGHWIFYTLNGVKAGFSFNNTYFINEWKEVLMGAIGGPLFSLVLALIGVIILYKIPRLSYFGAGLAIIMSLTRLLPYIVIVSTNTIKCNDEGVIAIYLNWPLWSIFSILLACFISILILVWRGLKNTRKEKIIIFTLAFWGYIFALGLEIGILEKIFFSGVDIRELVMPPGVY